MAQQWDRKEWQLQVTGSGERAVEVRAVFGAPDPGALWELRCAVREGLVAYLQREQRHALPRVRAAVESPPSVELPH
jgi:hypothetical protein